MWQKALLFLAPFGLIFQFVVASSGFYLDTVAMPPRLFFLGAVPSLLLILLVFVLARHSVVFPFSLTTLTIIHVIRIPVEITLAWLWEAGVVPSVMTFHGTNFDILSGITAPLALYFAYRPSRIGRNVLIVWNLVALAILVNTVTTAVPCVPPPIQKLAFDSPMLPFFTSRIFGCRRSSFLSHFSLILLPFTNSSATAEVKPCLDFCVSLYRGLESF